MGPLTSKEYKRPPDRSACMLRALLLRVDKLLQATLQPVGWENIPQVCRSRFDAFLQAGQLTDVNSTTVVSEIRNDEDAEQISPALLRRLPPIEVTFVMEVHNKKHYQFYSAPTANMIHIEYAETSQRFTMSIQRGNEVLVSAFCIFSDGDQPQDVEARLGVIGQMAKLVPNNPKSGG